MRVLPDAATPGWALSLPFLLLLIVELALRVIPGSGYELDPYINISPVSVFSRATVAGQEYYHITHPLVLRGSAVWFPVTKPRGTIRIFAVGSSACAGWPHPPSQTWTAYLQQALETAYPRKRFEVINAAAHGFAAYRTRRVVNEIVQMQPDAIFVWEGNNEFLEDRNYDPPATAIVALARHLRTVQWLRSVLQPRLRGDSLNGLAQVFWKKMHQQSLRLRSDPEQYAQVQAHFRESFQAMIRVAQEHGVPIVLLTVPVNLRDWLPTASHNDLVGERRRAWEAYYDEARRDALKGDAAAGTEAARHAIAMASEHAESWFWLGRLLEAQGRRADAWEAYSLARDLDYNPFRAISAFNRTIRGLAEENQGRGVFLLDLERLFAAASRYGSPGFDLFLDYVHPTKDGHLLVAQQAFDLITHGGLLADRRPTATFEYDDRPIAGSRAPYRDETDLPLQATVLFNTTENRQYEAVVHMSEALFQRVKGKQLTGPDDPALATTGHQFADRYRGFWLYVDAQRKFLLGQPGSAAALAEATRGVDAFYEKWYPPGVY